MFHVIGPSNPDTKTTEKAIVKVAYDAIDQDEISVQVGDVVDVISKVTEDEGWWKVMISVHSLVLLNNSYLIRGHHVTAM